MNLNVEFLGIARQLADTASCPISVDEGATFRDVLGQLALRYPPLVGPVIVAPSYDLQTDLRIIVDGVHQVTDLDTHPQEGQRLILMFGDVC